LTRLLGQQQQQQQQQQQLKRSHGRKVSREGRSRA
jgi:hypothetical protein